MGKDLYKILGVPRDADDRRLRTAYRSKAKQYHPDAGEGSSEEKFREIQDAYDTLANPADRAAYDRDLAGTVPVSSPLRHQYSRPRDPSHIDLNEVLAGRRPQPGYRAPRSSAGGIFLHDLEEILRLLDDLESPDW